MNPHVFGTWLRTEHGTRLQHWIAQKKERPELVVGARIIRFLWTFLSSAIVLLAFVSAILRLIPLGEAFPRVAVEAIADWFLLLAVLQLAVHAALKNRMRAALAAVTLCIHLSFSLPTWIPATQTQHTTHSLRVFSSNLYALSEEHAGLARELAQSNADVVSLQEFTPEWQTSLASAFVQYPHQVLVPRECCHGIALLSKYPIVRHQIIDIGNSIPAIAATLQVGTREIDVWSIHTLPPNQPAYTRFWTQQMAVLTEHLSDHPRPLIAMGDYNASAASRSYARLLRGTGLDGAHERVGRGYATTWPNGLLPLPSIRLDHILVSPDVRVESIREGVGHASDHRPLIARLTF